METFLKPSGGPEPAKLIPLSLHRHIKFRSSEIELRPDGRIRTIHILYTDLELNTASARYDASAVEELITRIQAHQETHHELIRLRTMP